HLGWQRRLRVVHLLRLNALRAQGVPRIPAGTAGALPVKDRLRLSLRFLRHGAAQHTPRPPAPPRLPSRAPRFMMPCSMSTEPDSTDCVIRSMTDDGAFRVIAAITTATARGALA